MSHNISLPRHRYVWVVPSFVLRDPMRTALVPAVWVGVSVTAGRSIGCHVLLESGAIVVDLPLHALRGAMVEYTPLEKVMMVSESPFSSRFHSLFSSVFAMSKLLPRSIELLTSSATTTLALGLF